MVVVFFLIVRVTKTDPYYLIALETLNQLAITNTELATSTGAIYVYVGVVFDG